MRCRDKEATRPNEGIKHDMSSPNLSLDTGQKEPCEQLSLPS